ncbi:DUF2804 domain-containing protein [Shewanella sp. Scap07]|uniref:DUF2804 domain-containing protein n=1 Tax=Shewanella sp. Scap07 TaxID=2589987 RepID=UPI0015B851E7|nr:DUF2804 domain-containing protein [Shewanella sp. Scap07]QLE86425.1 DUF2804 domain-containing protein [Shewanella sp. Scap07]
MIKTQRAPQELITSGKPEFGHFDGIVKQLAVDKFQYFSEMDTPRSGLAKHFAYKQFQFIAITTPRYMIGVALADIRYVGSSFCYVYDIKANKLVEHNFLRPLGLGYTMTDSPYSGRSSIAGGKVAFVIEDGLWQLTLNMKHIQADLRLTPLALSLPMAVCTPTGYSGWTYTQKHNGLKVSGTLTIEHEPQPLNQALGGYDFSAGFMRRETSWRWASINGRIADKIIGLNLAAGVNETGSNENVFWVDGERHLLGAVHFEFERHNRDSDWRVFSDDGRVDLQFMPHNCRKEKLNLVLLKSNFRQYIGTFSGTITDTKGCEHQISNVLGLTEDHFAKW